jgi:hypothetical protein
MTVHDIRQYMQIRQQYVESLIETEDYDIDDDDERELIQLLHIESLGDDDDEFAAN